MHNWCLFRVFSPLLPLENPFKLLSGTMKAPAAARGSPWPLLSTPWQNTLTRQKAGPYLGEKRVLSPVTESVTRPQGLGSRVS